MRSNVRPSGEREVRTGRPFGFHSVGEYTVGLLGDSRSIGKEPLVASQNTVSAVPSGAHRLTVATAEINVPSFSTQDTCLELNGASIHTVGVASNDFENEIVP